jgi:hypothetical protein
MDDPQRLPEVFVFLPSLRRSLRLSSSSRCSPLLGGDFSQEDNSGGVPLPPGLFQATFLGEKKILMLIPPSENLAWTDYKNYFHPSFWPKPIIGKWQVRDAYVVDIRRLPKYASGYCYGKRIDYIDKQTGFAVYIDLYDESLKFWKMEMYVQTPAPVPGGGYTLEFHTYANMYDFQNMHQSPAIEPEIEINSQVPQKYSDFSRYGSPAGLQKVMQ